MLTPKQAELMKLAIKEGCRWHWNIKIEDMVSDFSQKTPDVGEDGFHLRSSHFFLKTSDGTRIYYAPVYVHHKDKKDVLLFSVNLFKNGNESDWFSIRGMFVGDTLLNGIVGTSETSFRKTLTASFSRFHNPINIVAPFIY